MSVEIRVFLGYERTSEVSAFLSRSKAWKEDQLNASLSLADKEIALQETDREGKGYIGIVLPEEIDLSHLKEVALQLTSKLERYCPKLKLDNRSLHVFSQLFLS